MFGLLLLLLPATASFTEASSPNWPMMGWDAFRKFNFYTLRPGDVTRQFSSYDRNNLNDDGFEGTYSCLYNTTAGRCVIAEAPGPGQISDIWFTYENTSVIGVGDIQVELDGKVVLEGVVQDIVHGSVGPPFVWPLVGDVNDTSGGNVIKVPMPYKESMRVSTSTNPHFQHVVYRSFPDDVEVETFDPEEDVSDVLDAMYAFGVQDPKGADYWSGYVDTEYGSTTDVLEIEGCGVVDELQIRIPEILGAHVVTDDGRAFGDGGFSSFKLRVDGSASQCTITRRLDRSVGNQKAAVSIDGQDAGTWQPLPAANATWDDQILALDPALTQGKSSITVQNTFISSDVDFNEFYYATHCLSEGSQDWQLTDVFNVGYNNLHDEAAHSYQITGQTWEGLRYWYTYGGDRKTEAQDSIISLNSIYLNMWFDGHMTVSQPLGSFFGDALQKFDVRTLLLSVDTFVENGAFTSWFPKPFSKSFKLSLTRLTTLLEPAAPIPGSVSVKWHEDSSLASRSDWGYFSTEHNRGDTITGELWSFLSKPGKGIACGVTHAMRGSIKPPDNALEFLEGDLQVWYNRTTPGTFDDAALLGTGTEDFYESGWYFADGEVKPYGVNSVPYSMPLGSLTGSEFEVLDCVGQCVSPLRLMVPESLAYDNGISMNIEHGPEHNNINADYETTAFYYAPAT